MSWADAVNGFFEFGMAMAILPSVFKLLREREVRGFHWFHVAFPTAWGFWNLYYYPSLDQWASFWGGLAVVSVNCFYLALVFRFRARA